MSPFRVGETVYISALEETVFRFDEETGRFTEDHTFDGARSGHSPGWFTLQEDAEGRVWIASTYGSPTMAHPHGEGTYTFETFRAFRWQTPVV